MKQLKESTFIPYCNKELELSVERGCVLWGYRVVIPHTLRKVVLRQLHESHLGIVKTKAMARSYVWWPKIDNDIEVLIKNCKACQELQQSQKKHSNSLVSHKPNLESHSYRLRRTDSRLFLFIIIDSHSKWVEVFKTKDITSHFVISKLRETFCRYGIVNTIVSDNGRQFVSSDFKEYIRSNKIQHVLTSPGQPSTNGQAENFVKTIKKSINANLHDNKTDFDVILNRFLMDYRNTTHCSTKKLQLNFS